MKKIDIITLGCAKNRVDSEHIAQALSLGYEIFFDDEALGADDFRYDVVVINTCGFILDAKEESVNTILLAAEAKREGKIGRLYVIGCLSQRYADDLRVEIPEVDSYFGARDFSELLTILEGDSSIIGRQLSTPEHTAYLKIAEGCNWGCGYCAIPAIRGQYRSVPLEELVSEAKWLVERGVRELIVIAQDSTYYGMDLYGERKLGTLLRELCKIEDLEWIRLQYAYPTGFPEDVIDVMAEESKVCNYLDIPFQHISDNQLKTMRRGITKAETLELIDRLRAKVPDIAIRTTLITGYPTETEEDFEELKDFVRTAKIERLGVFPYSEEEGTYSALNFEDSIPQEIKESRAAEIMAIQEEIAEEISASRVGRRLRVLIDSIQGDFFVARSEWDSVEVDGEVLITITDDIEDEESYIGEFVDVEITSSIAYDLYAKIVE